MKDEELDERIARDDYQEFRKFRREVENARTPNGGYTREQLAKWGVPWPPPSGWKKKLLA